MLSNASPTTPKPFPPFLVGGATAAADLSHLVVPEADYASDSEEEEGEEEEEEQEQGQEQHQSSPPIGDTPRKRSR